VAATVAEIEDDDEGAIFCQLTELSWSLAIVGKREVRSGLVEEGGGGGWSRFKTRAAEDFAETAGELAGLNDLDVGFGVAADIAGGDESVAKADLAAAFEEPFGFGEFLDWVCAVVDEDCGVEAGNEEQPRKMRVPRSRSATGVAG
jgi:hypothetical protein